jgi:hypothetical protein
MDAGERHEYILIDKAKYLPLLARRIAIANELQG